MIEVLNPSVEKIKRLIRDITLRIDHQRIDPIEGYNRIYELENQLKRVK